MNVVHDPNFDIAREKLNSKVRYELMDVMDLTPKELGFFDFIFCGTMLLHLSDPIYALKNIRNSVRNGLFIVATTIDRPKKRRRILGDWRNKASFAKLMKHSTGPTASPTYWIPSIRGMEEMLRKAWFEDVRLHSRFDYPQEDGSTGKRVLNPHACFHCRVG